jgi:hypothetical protein
MVRAVICASEMHNTNAPLLPHFFLRVYNRIKRITGCHFGNSLEYFSKYDRHFIYTDDNTSENVIKQNKDVDDYPTLFKLSKKLIPAIKKFFDQNLARTTRDVIVKIPQPKYISVFLMIYLGYLNSILVDALIQQFGNDLPDQKIGDSVSIDKILLNQHIGTQNNLKELVYANGMLLKSDTSKKLQIIIQGESILPALQKKLNFALPIKSYCVQAQLFQDNIQLSLNQVVVSWYRG